MNKEPILLVMAAGMGSRYGGLKQIDPVGPGGEVILDYSVFDAWRAGFRRVIFLIKKAIAEDFIGTVGKRAEAHMEVRYAYQELDKIPASFAVPEGRVKPWGTGHAVLCCREWIDAPFAVINADDFYGADAFRQAYRFLTEKASADRWMMVGYALKNTLSETGYVARGICTADDQGNLADIVETTHIISTCDGPLSTQDGVHYLRHDPEVPVSMNMWGFDPSLLDALEAQFPAFLEKALRENPQKAEFFLPSVVDELLKQGKVSVAILPCRDKWYGVTYQEDKPLVKAALAGMQAQGLYASPLWED